MKRKYTTPTKLVILALAMITVSTLPLSGATAAMEEEESVCSLYGHRLTATRHLWCDGKPEPKLRFRHEYGHRIEDHLPAILAFAVAKILFAVGGLAIWHHLRRKRTGPAQSLGV